MLTEDELETLIDTHWCRPRDRMFRMERLPWYDVPAQNADRTAWLNGRPDTAALEAWAGVLADCAARGLVSERARVLSEDLTADEAMTCHIALPIIGRDQDIRILHRGEHPVPAILDHDYWVLRPAAGGIHIARMIYTFGGRFVGADIVPESGHEPYLREQRLAWAIGEPFAHWWARSTDLRRASAA